MFTVSISLSLGTAYLLTYLDTTKQSEFNSSVLEPLALQLLTSLLCANHRTEREIKSELLFDG
jgi:hypothetical protein